MNKTLKLILEKDNIIYISFGKKIKNTQLEKVKIRPMIIKNENKYQIESFSDNKAYHTNINTEELYNYIMDNLINNFKEIYIFTEQNDYTIYINKNNSIKIIKKKASKKKNIELSHDKKKNYIIDKQDKPDFLVDLGIMTKEYEVKKNTYDKFRQINKFIEILNDDIDIVGDNINVVDFCCGKGYLTLATWYYLNHIKNKKNKIIGIDLKSDVIGYLNNLNYKGIEFLDMDINDYKDGKIDIAIGLHACDIATDISIYNAVKNNAKLILMVPCCQHELFNMIDNQVLEPMLKYGILKDKMTELVTNTLRGLALEAVGYEVKMIEFTSLEHTMKNVMIKARYKGVKNKEALEKYKVIEKQFNVKCSIDKVFYIDNKIGN